MPSGALPSRNAVYFSYIGLSVSVCVLPLVHLVRLPLVRADDGLF